MTRSHYIFGSKFQLQGAPWAYVALALVLVPFMLSSEFGCAKKVVPVLSVGSNQWPGYEPMYTARQLGWVDKHDIKLVEYSSTTEVIDALKFGLLDAAGLTLDEFLTAREKGVKLSIVMIFDYSKGADAIFAKSSIKQLSDLKGKYIGVESTAVGDFLLQEALAKAGLKRSDVHVVYATPSEHVALFHKGKVDAVVSFNPYLAKLEALGGKRLFDSAMMPESIVDVLVVRDAMLTQQADHIQTLIHQTLKATNYLGNDKNAVNSIQHRRMLGKAESENLFNGIKLSYLNENYKNLVEDSSSLLKTISKLKRLVDAHLIEQGKAHSLQNISSQKADSQTTWLDTKFIQNEMEMQQGL